MHMHATYQHALCLRRGEHVGEQKAPAPTTRDMYLYIHTHMLGCKVCMLYIAWRLSSCIVLARKSVGEGKAYFIQRLAFRVWRYTFTRKDRSDIDLNSLLQVTGPNGWKTAITSGPWKWSASDRSLSFRFESDPVRFESQTNKLWLFLSNSWAKPLLSGAKLLSCCLELSCWRTAQATAREEEKKHIHIETSLYTDTNTHTCIGIYDWSVVA